VVGYADDFDSLEAEAQRSDDHMAYMPDVTGPPLMEVCPNFWSDRGWEDEAGGAAITVKTRWDNLCKMMKANECWLEPLTAFSKENREDILRSNDT
jgi:hypothetical protein